MSSLSLQAKIATFALTYRKYARAQCVHLRSLDAGEISRNSASKALISLEKERTVYPRHCRHYLGRAVIERLPSSKFGFPVGGCRHAGTSKRVNSRCR